MISLKEKFIILVDNDCLKPSDAIIMLEGDGHNRTDKVVDLYKNKYAEKVVFSGGIFNPAYGSLTKEYIVPNLAKKGISEKDIIIEDKSQNTRDEAVEIMKICKNKVWKRIILVASNYHQYRAYLTFLKAMQESGSMIEILNAAANNLKWFEETGWGKRFELLSLEFEKIDKYSKLGHVSSFEEAIEYQKWKEEQI